MKRKGFIFIGISIIAFTVQAQVAMGKWRTHFAYNLVSQISQSENKVFAVSEGSLFSIDKRDGSIELYSKITGLNGSFITRTGYDEYNKTLLITYQDGNIDFITANGVKNLPDYYNKQMSVDKAVNHIHFERDKAFLSCNFGIITLNMAKMEIQDTYYIGQNASDVIVLNSTRYGGNIYAVSKTDIYVGEASNPLLINYESWSKMTGLPGSGDYQALVNFNDQLILLRSGKLYKQDTNGSWSNLDVSVNYTRITLSEGYLQGFTTNGAYLFNNQFVKTQVTGLSSLNYGLYDSVSSKFWFSGDPKGVAEYTPNGSSPIINFYKLNGPAVNIPYKLKFAGDRLFVLQGGRTSVQLDRPGYVMIYEDNQWRNIDPAIFLEATGKVALDFVDVDVDPEDKKHFFVSSFGTGVYEFRDDNFYKWYTFENSILESVFTNNFKYIRIEAAAYDNDKNLWFLDPTVSRHRFKILKNDGNWILLDHSEFSEGLAMSDILISNQNPNQKWFIAYRYMPGISILDDNGTIDDPSDDKYVIHKSFTYSANDAINTLIPTLVNCIAQDRNGVIWIGTNDGPILYNNLSNVFTSNFIGSRIVIPRNDGTGLGDYLLEGETVTAIAIDGANRKWLGTETSGVFLMSENGQETIHHFTTINSPLISNNILSIDINQITGEVFIGTGVGLVSYQSDSAEPGSVFDNVHVYPNPVRETFNGVITITGLVEKTTVKITDVAGNLVCETTSNGSIATWDGKNKFGQKVSTGVYLAICVAPNGEQSATTKILVIN